MDTMITLEGNMSRQMLEVGLLKMLRAPAIFLGVAMAAHGGDALAHGLGHFGADQLS